MNLPTRSWFFFIMCLVSLLGLFIPAAQAAPAVELSKGQLVYVPVYSHIYYGDQERQFPLNAILSIRNTDPVHPITIVLVDYYDTDGKLVRKYLSKPFILRPLGSTRYVITESDKAGGSGANFLVKWQAEIEVNEPIFEGVMIGTAAAQGISFTSRGKAIKNR